MSKHIALGKEGERIASTFLLEKGHRLLERNFRVGHNEVDIISLSGDILVFTEIKTRSNYYMGFPEEAVDKRKQLALKKVAECYQLDHPQYIKIRFDVISLLLREGRILEILHFEDAFY